MNAITHPPQNPNNTPDTNLWKLAGATRSARITYRISHAIIPMKPFSGNQ